MASSNVNLGEKFFMSEKQKQKIVFQLVESARSRRVYLKISPTKGLEIIVPRRFNLAKLPQVIKEKEAWIFKTLQKVNERAEEKKKFQFEDGAKISILGEEKIIRFANDQKLRSYVHESGQELKIFKNSSILSSQELFEKYLKTKAKIYFLKQTHFISVEMGLTYGRITVRAQKSRWGSCSRYGNLSFNWKLLLAPVQSAEYVIIHELAHTVHHNHSKKFYDLVAKFCPDYKKWRSILQNSNFII